MFTKSQPELGKSNSFLALHIFTANKLFTQQKTNKQTNKQKKRRGVPGISRYHMQIDTMQALTLFSFLSGQGKSLGMRLHLSQNVFTFS